MGEEGRAQILEGELSARNWREVERSIVEFFRREGPKPHSMAGEWYIKSGNKRINISALARELALGAESEAA